MQVSVRIRPAPNELIWPGTDFTFFASDKIQPRYSFGKMEYNWSLWESGQVAQTGQGQFIGGQSEFTIQSSGGYLHIEPQVPAWVILNSPSLNLTIFSDGQNNSQNQNNDG